MNNIERAIEYFYRQMESGNITNDNQQKHYEIAIDALEKQILKKPKCNNDEWYCPSCNEFIRDNECMCDAPENDKYCTGCGSKARLELID